MDLHRQDCINRQICSTGNLSMSLAESRGEWGYMWECPDFYPVGDKYVLMFSPMGGKERTSVYLVGDFDYDTGKFFYDLRGN